MFLGEYQHNLDNKGRLIIPASLREELGETFIATKGFENCLFIYPRQEWKRLEEKLSTLPFTRPEVRAFSRVFFGGACECELDKQGRVLLPPNLREYADIDRDVVIIGVGSRLEIWSALRWKGYAENALDSYAELAEKMGIDL